MNNTTNPHVWLRAEQKLNEARTVLTPAVARKMLRKGFTVTVEESASRCIGIEDYREVGCDIVAGGSWIEAPLDAIILGLKELSDDSTVLRHSHVHFGHVFKQQQGWQEMMGRFRAGDGALYDLEFLVDSHGKRVAAFGYWAGFAGAALGLMAWARRSLNNAPVLHSIEPCPNKSVLIENVLKDLTSLDMSATQLKKPSVVVIGAKGRSGAGALACCAAAGIEVTEWDMEETKSGGPFAELMQFNILINCVLINDPLPPFVDDALLDKDGRSLTTIVDVSCDPYGQNNPLPIYQRATSFDEPVQTIRKRPPLDLVAIDHLPSMLPLESTNDFVEQLEPHLLQLDNLDTGVWARALDTYNKTLAQL